MGGRRKRARGQALRLAWTQKSMPPLGKKTRCDYWRRVMVKRRTRILYTGAFFFRVRTVYIRRCLKRVRKNTDYDSSMLRNLIFLLISSKQLTVRGHEGGTEEKGDDRRAPTEVVPHYVEINEKLRQMSATLTTFECTCMEELPKTYFGGSEASTPAMNSATILK